MNARSLDEYLGLLEFYRQPLHVFRGVHCWTHDLTPRIGRTFRIWEAAGNAREICLRSEGDAYWEFRREARAHGYANLNALEWLALAQHHGVSTRMLDWTGNPLCALYFALDPDVPKADGDFAVFVLPSAKIGWLTDADVPEEKAQRQDQGIPACLRGIAEPRAFTPPRFSHRILAQASVMTFHPRPWEALSGHGILRIRFPASARKRLREQLNWLHVTAKSLFPDLAGLGASIRHWRFEPLLWEETGPKPT